MIKTEDSKVVRDYLKKYELETLNLAGIIDNVKDAQIYTDSLQNPTGVLVRYKYFNYIHTENINFINDMFNELFPPGKYGFAGTTRFISAQIKKHFAIDWENDCDFYYIPKENYDRVSLKSNVKSIDINDAKYIDDYYNHKNSHTLYEIQYAIENRPSSVIYIDDKIASWVLVHEDASLGIMYTLEEHRGKGFALDVATDLSKKIIDTGKIPFLQIISTNTMSPSLAKKIGFIKKFEADWFGIII